MRPCFHGRKGSQWLPDPGVCLGPTVKALFLGDQKMLQNGTASPLCSASSLDLPPPYLPPTCTMDQLRCCGHNFNKWRACVPISKPRHIWRHGAWSNYVDFWLTWMACLGNELKPRKAFHPGKSAAVADIVTSPGLRLVQCNLLFISLTPNQRIWGLAKGQATTGFII